MNSLCDAVNVGKGGTEYLKVIRNRALVTLSTERPRLVGMQGYHKSYEPRMSLKLNANKRWYFDSVVGGINTPNGGGG